MHVYQQNWIVTITFYDLMKSGEIILEGKNRKQKFLGQIEKGDSDKCLRK